MNVFHKNMIDVHVFVQQEPAEKTHVHQSYFLCNTLGQVDNLENT